MKAPKKRKYVPTQRELRFLILFYVHEQQFLEAGMDTFGDIEQRKLYVAKKLELIDQALGEGSVDRLRKFLEENRYTAWRAENPRWVALADSPDDRPDGSSPSEDE